MTDRSANTQSRLSTGGQPDVTHKTTSDHWYDLVQFQNLPHWQQDNAHILTGYRQASYSYPRSFSSILQWHNESVNIWTHLIPAVISLPAATVLYNVIKPRYERATKADVVAMSCYFLGAATCLGLSATFHTLSNHSPVVAKFWNQLDYVGIAVLISGSFVPSIYYGFWCDPGLQRLYWTMISVLGVGCIATSLLPRFRGPAWRPVRALMFIGMGLSAVFPVIHGLFRYGLKDMTKQIGLPWLVLQGVLYVVGASMYAMRFPERTAPGRYDYCGSHAIFHIFVVLAAVSHLVGLLTAFDYRHGIPGVLCI